MWAFCKIKMFCNTALFTNKTYLWTYDVLCFVCLHCVYIVVWSILLSELGCNSASLSTCLFFLFQAHICCVYILTDGFNLYNKNMCLLKL